MMPRPFNCQKAFLDSRSRKRRKTMLRTLRNYKSAGAASKAQLILPCSRPGLRLHATYMSRLKAMTCLCAATLEAVSRRLTGSLEEPGIVVVSELQKLADLAGQRDGEGGR